MMKLVKITLKLEIPDSDPFYLHIELSQADLKAGMLSGKHSALESWQHAFATQAGYFWTDRDVREAVLK